jgi:formamidopyrimidine-DNA glycosylase
MPELPEVETVRRGLAPAMEGKRIIRAETRRPDLRFPFPPNFGARVSGARLIALGRRAKYLIGELSTGEALIMHLGMTGRFTITEKKKKGRPGEFHHETGGDPTHDHVVFELEGGTTVTFNDPRRFGSMDLWPLGELDSYPSLEGLGPEPISNAFSGAYLREAFKGKKAPVKAALLDQRMVAGLGNIYVSEALFRSGINPEKLAGAIRPDRLERLAEEVRKVIDEAIVAGGSSISDFANTSGELGYFQHRFQVYDREGEPCVVCARPVKRIVQSGRSTFYCGKCQR